MKAVYQKPIIELMQYVWDMPIADLSNNGEGWDDVDPEMGD